MERLLLLKVSRQGAVGSGKKIRSLPLPIHYCPLPFDKSIFNEKM